MLPENTISACSLRVGESSDMYQMCGFHLFPPGWWTQPGLRCYGNRSVWHFAVQLQKFCLFIGSWKLWYWPRWRWILSCQLYTIIPLYLLLYNIVANSILCFLIVLLQSLYFLDILFCLFISLNRLPLTLIPNTETIHWSFSGPPGAVAIVEPFACGCLLASVPCC